MPDIQDGAFFNDELDVRDPEDIVAEESETEESTETEVPEDSAVAEDVETGKADEGDPDAVDPDNDDPIVTGEEEDKKDSEEDEELDEDDELDEDEEEFEDSEEDYSEVPLSNDEITREMEDLQEKNPVFAERVYGALEELRDMRETIRDVPPQDLKVFAQNHEQVTKHLQERVELEESFNQADEFLALGDMENALNSVGFDTDSIEKYYANKFQAENDGELQSFMSQFERSPEVVRVSQENRDLKRRLSNMENASMASDRDYWDNVLKRDPVMVEMDSFMGERGYAARAIDQAMAADPQNAGNVDMIVNQVRSQFKHILSKSSPRQSERRQLPPSPRASQPRKRGLRPPSEGNKNRGRAAISGKRSVPTELHHLFS